MNGTVRRDVSARLGLMIAGAGAMCSYAPAQCPYELGQVTTAVAQFLTSYPEVPGCVVRVQRGERVIYERAFGAYTLETVLPIASASKWPAGAVIMSLVDDGTITLDQTLGQYLTSYAAPGLDRMTFRQAFAHTSGLPANTAGRGAEEWNDCLNDRFTTLQACAEAIATRGLRTDGMGVPIAPGTDFAYGGCSMQAAGAAAEIAAGKSWTTLLHERLRKPLGLTSMTYGVGPNPRVAGGINCNARDYALFLQMILENGASQGGQVLSGDAVVEMLTDQTNGVPVTYAPPVAVSAGFVGYGVGNWTNVVDGSGQTREASSEGAFGFSPWIDLRRETFVVVLVLDQNTRVRPLVEQIQAIVRLAVDRTSDIDASGTVDFADITRVLVNYNSPSLVGEIQGPGPIGDVSGNGVVDFPDITRVLLRYGDLCD